MSQTKTSSNGKEKEFKPRYAKSVEDLIFYTDTDQSDYPIYVLPSFEIVYKKVPEGVDRFAVFHVKNINVYDENKAREFEKQLEERYGLSKIIETLKGLKLVPSVEVVGIEYEVYRGDYDELVNDNVNAYFARVKCLIKEVKYGLSKQHWAIGYSYLKRAQVKLQHISNLMYLKTERPFSKREALYLYIKLPIPTQEIESVYSNISRYLQGLEEPLESEEAEESVESEETVAQQAIEIPEIKPKELEIEVAIPEIKIEPMKFDFEVPLITPTTAVTTEQTPTTTTPIKKELVKIYLLSMKLPSKYLLQKVEVSENAEVRKWEGLAADVASRLEGIRRTAYDRISRIFAHVEEFGTWIAVSDDAVKEATELSKWVMDELSKLPLKQIKSIDISKLYMVKTIPVYLEPEDAKMLIDAAIQHMSVDVAELESRVAEAEKEQRKSVLKRLEQDLQYKKTLLETLKRFVASINI